MRVLHLYSGNLFGGIERILIALARHQESAAGLDQWFALGYVGRLARELSDAHARTVALPRARWRNPFSIRASRVALAELLDRERVDAAVCHASWSQAVFGPVVRGKGVPLVYWAHDAPLGRHWLDRLARRARPELAIGNSLYTTVSLASMYAQVPAVCLYAPVEGPHRRARPRQTRAVRQRLHTARNAVVIVHVARMQQWKGHRLLLEALARLEGSLAYCCWFVGGAQRASERRYQRELYVHAHRLGIEERVRFVGQRDNVWDPLLAADICCQPNTKPEPFGVALVEAQLAGLPVVTSAMGGAAELVDARSGVLVPLGNVDALAAALVRLTQDAGLRRRLGEAGRRRVRHLCDPAGQTRRFAELIQSECCRGRDGRRHAPAPARPACSAEHVHSAEPIGATGGEASGW